MGVIKDKILDTLEKHNKLTFNQLYKFTQIHPLILRKLLKELEKEGKVKINKVKRPHNPKKFEIIIEI